MKCVNSWCAIVARATAALFIALVVGQPAHAGKVAAWRHASQADFEKGELQGAVVSRSGDVTIGRDVRVVADLECATVWDLLRTVDGKLLAATALPGKVVEFDQAGKKTTLWRKDDAQAFCLAAMADGSLLVGTGPEGTIFKIGADGQSAEFCRTGALYVWDMVVDGQGNVYAATGPTGTIYQIDAAAQCRPFYETRQQHVLVLQRRDDGSLLAATDGAGLVLTIDPSGQGRVLYDTAEGEVRALWLSHDGSLFVGTATPGEAGGPAAAPAASSSDSAATNPMAGRPKAGQNSVYRIDTDGGVRKLFSTKGLFYSLFELAREQPQQLLAGTGAEAVLYRLDAEGGAEQPLARLDAELILSIVLGGDGEVLLATGNPGKVYAVSTTFRKSGALVSAALDAGMVARFGSLTWRAELHECTQVSLAVRSGNTQTPDETWSDWSVEQTHADHAQAACPPGRFLQYRATLSTTDAQVTPTLRSVGVHYLTSNQPPRIASVTVPHVDEGDGKQRFDKLKLTWQAADANGDELEYKLLFRKPQWQSWITLKDSLTATEHEWDVTSVPEGIYQVKVEVSDRRSNPPEAALGNSFVSEPFVVDLNGPRLEAKLTGTGTEQIASFEVEARDEISPLVSASYSVDSAPWVTTFPRDELFDSTEEQLRFDVPGLKPGTHVVVIQATDAAGRTSSTDVVFEVGTWVPAAANASDVSR